MRQPALFIAATILSSAAPPVFANDDELTVSASTVEARTDPIDPERRRLYLPALTFSLQARFACAAPEAVATINVSVADTHKRYEPGDGEQSIDATIDVPRHQFAPVATGTFCLQGKAGEQRHLELPGVATAQVSLRCQSDNLAAVRYASVPLPVRLECIPARDQVPAPASR